MKKSHIILGLFWVLGAYLRLWNVAQYPAWYTDEATHIEIARWLMQGDSRYFAVQDSWLLFARLPLFEYVLAGVFQVFGVSMLALRGFTACLGILTAIMLYVVMNNCTKNYRLAVVSSAVWCILPQAVLYNRFGFSYNLLLPLILLIVLGFHHYRQTAKHKWLVLAALCIGLGTVSEVLMWGFVPLVVVVTSSVRWRDSVWALPLTLAPLTLYFASQLLLVPDAFLFDLGYTVSRTGGGNLSAQGQLLIQNYTVLLGNIWWVVALIGLVLIRDRTLQFVLALMLIPLLLIGRTVPLYSLSAYYLIPFLPIVAIGIASFFVRAWEYVIEHFRMPVAIGLMLILVGSPIAYQTWSLYQSVQTGFVTEIDAFSVEPNAAREVADYINQNAQPNDIAITSAPIGWMIDQSIYVADFQMAAIANGEDAVHIPANLPRERLAFNPAFKNADYVIIDNLWRNWGAVHIPQIATLMQQLDSWELVYEVGEIRAYVRE